MTTLVWEVEAPKQPEDGRYRLIAFRQRTACWRFSVEKSRNPRTGRTYFTARCHRFDRLGPVSVWLGEFDDAAAARAVCQAYLEQHLTLPAAPEEPHDDVFEILSEEAA